MKTKKIAINVFYYGFVPKLTMFINILILPLITPFLTPFDYGISGVVSSYKDILLCIAPLGLNLYLTNSFYEIPKNYRLVWGRVYYLFFLSGLFIGILNTAILYLVLPIENKLNLLFLSFLSSFPIFFMSSPRIAGQLFPYLERPKPLAFTNLFTSLCGLIISFVAIYYFRLGYWGLVLNSTSCSIISFLIFYFILRKHEIKLIPKIKWTRVKQMLNKSLPLVPHTLGFMLLSNSARIIMNFYNVEYDEIGLFSHGYQMGAYIVIITSSLATALAPQMQTTFRKGNYKQFRLLFYLSQSISIIASFLVCIWMKEIYGVLIDNDELMISSSIATIICFAQVMLPFYYFSAVSCYVERNTKQLLWLVFFPGILNIVFCFICIPIWGYKAAAYSTLVSYWSQLLMPFIVPYHKKWNKIWLGSNTILILLLIIVSILVVCANILVFFPVYAKIIISSIVIASFSYLYIKRIRTKVVNI